MPDPTYVAPTRSAFRAQVARSVRDTGYLVFNTTLINDFIREGLLDLSGFRPVDVSETMLYSGSPMIPEQVAFIWQVEASSSVSGFGNAIVLPYVSAGETYFRNGWDFYGGRLYFGRWWSAYLANWQNALVQTEDDLNIRMSGYRDRSLPDSDDDVLDFLEATDELYLGWYCRMLAFQALNNDRSLYQQWLAATNNTDVSPTQLQGMLSSAQSEVERIRKRMSLLRRVPVIGPQWV